MALSMASRSASNCSMIWAVFMSTDYMDWAMIRKCLVGFDWGQNDHDGFGLNDSLEQIAAGSTTIFAAAIGGDGASTVTRLPWRWLVSNRSAPVLLLFGSRVTFIRTAERPSVPRGWRATLGNSKLPSR